MPNARAQQVSPPSSAPSVEQVVPPQLLEEVTAIIPGDAPPSASAVVRFWVVVERDGSVSTVELAEPAREAFEIAAKDAVLRFRFRPAMRGGDPVRVRIGVPVRLVPQAAPVAESDESSAPSSGDTPADASAPSAPQAARAPAPELAPSSANRDDVPATADAPVQNAASSAKAPTTEPAHSAHDEPALEVTVIGERHLRDLDRGASDFTLSGDLLRAAPHRDGSEVLNVVPGLTVSRAEGMAVGQRYMLRGFDADHGQDIEFTVGGIPINIPSHIHGQGYADLGFLIPEAVDELRASEGVYDPRQGDFAVAGSMDLQLGVARRGWQVKSSYGSFNSFRTLLLWAPVDQPRGTFGAAQYQQTSGFGENRRGQSASAVLQSRFDSGAWRHRFLGILYGARAQLPGVLRREDVNSGRVGYYDVYPFATARAQNALAGRVLVGGFSEFRGESGDNAELGVWVGVDNFRLQENYTGFIQRSQTLLDVAGRGDLIEQQNRTRSLGVMGRYASRVYRPWDNVSGSMELGLAGRVDETVQTQALLDAGLHGQTWDRRVDATILGTNLGLWFDTCWHLGPKVRLRVGAREDVLFYDVDDRLGNFATQIRPKDTYIVGYRRSAWGAALGPRTSLEVKPIEGLSLRAAYGEGYRSPQARQLDDGEQSAFSKVRSADVGARFALNEHYQLTLAGYYTRLSDDVAFSAEEGRMERIGATRRLGATLHAEARPLEWILGALSVTYVDAELLEPPPASADEPSPPFKAGQNLPDVPPLVVRLDGMVKHALTQVWGRELQGRISSGFSYLSARPLAYGAFSAPVALWDAGLAFSLSGAELSFDVYNLLGRRYAASEYNFPSNWEPDAPRSRVPARHFSAGAPRAFSVSLGVSL